MARFGKAVASALACFFCGARGARIDSSFEKTAVRIVKGATAGAYDDCVEISARIDELVRAGAIAPVGAGNYGVTMLYSPKEGSADMAHALKITKGDASAPKEVKVLDTLSSLREEHGAPLFLHHYGSATCGCDIVPKLLRDAIARKQRQKAKLGIGSKFDGKCQFIDMEALKDGCDVEALGNPRSKKCPSPNSEEKSSIAFQIVAAYEMGLKYTGFVHKDAHLDNYGMGERTQDLGTAQFAYFRLPAGYVSGTPASPGRTIDRDYVWKVPLMKEFGLLKLIDFGLSRLGQRTLSKRMEVNRVKMVLSGMVSDRDLKEKLTETTMDAANGWTDMLIHDFDGLLTDEAIPDGAYVVTMG